MPKSLKTNFDFTKSKKKLSSVLSAQVRWVGKTNRSGWEISAVSASNNDQFFVKSIYL